MSEPPVPTVLRPPPPRPMRQQNMEETLQVLQRVGRAQHEAARELTAPLGAREADSDVD